MATTFRQPISGLTSVWGGSSVSNETHVIPLSSPYGVMLDRIPKCTSTGTSALDNTYVSLVDLGTVLSVTIAGSPATLTASSSPSAGRVYCQIIDSIYSFSPLLLFNAADAGKTVVVNYTGYMSNLAGQYVTALQDAVTRLETFPACAVVSLNEYSAGRFDNTVADGTSVYVLGVGGHLRFLTGHYTFTTTAVNLATGTNQVTAFTDVDGYKQIGVWLIDNAGTVEVTTTEGAESATKLGTTAPPDYSGDAIQCGVIVVQGDGTGSAGGIEPVAQTDITMQTTVVLSSSLVQVPFTYEWQIDGSVLADTDAAGPWFPGFAGTITSLKLVLADSGASGSATVVDCNISGTSIYSVSGTQPTIAAGAGTYQVNASTDMGTTTFASTDYLTIDIDSAAVDAQTARIIISGVKS
jgi:hypothetical protein